MDIAADMVAAAAADDDTVDIEVAVADTVAADTVAAGTLRKLPVLETHVARSTPLTKLSREGARPSWTTGSS